MEGLFSGVVPSAGCTTLKTFHVWCNLKSQRKRRPLANLFGGLKAMGFGCFSNGLKITKYAHKMFSIDRCWPGVAGK